MIISSFSLTEASLACATGIGAVAGCMKMSRCKVIKCCGLIECERQVDEEDVILDEPVGDKAEPSKIKKKINIKNELESKI